MEPHRWPWQGISGAWTSWFFSAAGLPVGCSDEEDITPHPQNTPPAHATSCPVVHRVRKSLVDTQR